MRNIRDDRVLRDVVVSGTRGYGMIRYRGVVLCSQCGCKEWECSLMGVLRRCFALL